MLEGYFPVRTRVEIKCGRAREMWPLPSAGTKPASPALAAMGGRGWAKIR